MVGLVEDNEPDQDAQLPDSVPQHSGREFVSRQDFNILNNQLEEKFAHFGALLTRTNIFSTPKCRLQSPTQWCQRHHFINPSPDPRATSPVRPPGQDTTVKPKEKKVKGVGKSRDKKKKSASSGSLVHFHF